MMEDIPKISKGDIVHKVVKGGLSAIPFAGGQIGRAHV
jgi:hypothetical protein